MNVSWAGVALAQAAAGGSGRALSGSLGNQEVIAFTVGACGVTDVDGPTVGLCHFLRFFTRPPQSVQICRVRVGFCGTKPHSFSI